MKVAVVTPYYKEPPEILRRCIESVRAQTHPQVQHYMVADGHPQPELLAQYPEVASAVLPAANADFGDTPRAIGALCALSAGADVVCFLDADNLYAPEHVASLVEVYERGRASGTPHDAVFAYRQLFFPDHPALRYKDPEDIDHRHVDTNCVSLARSAAFLWPGFGLIPKNMSPIGDRVFFKLVRHHRLNIAWTGRHTVLYESNWAAHYLRAGLPVPATAQRGGHSDKVRETFSAQEFYEHLRVRIRK